MRILPTPKQMELYDHAFVFGKQATCTVCCDNIDKELLCKLFHRFTHTASELTMEENANGIPYTMLFGDYNAPVQKVDGQSEYYIHITDQGACIRGMNRVGMLHGYFTFLQMIETHCLDYGSEKFSVSCGIVKDWGDLKFRGIQICVFPETTLDFLRKAVLLSAFYKYTHIKLTFWGSLKFDCLKELAWENAYSKDEIRAIIDEARAMGVEFVPMVNCFGHAPNARERYAKHVILDQNPRLALLFEEDGWTWCLSNPESLRIMKAMREEMMELCGEGQYMCLGFDEAYSYATCPICRKKDKKDMFVDYVNGLAEELKGYGRQLQIAGDMFLDKDRWQLPIWATGRREHGLCSCLDRLSKDIIIRDWQYEVQEGVAESTAFFIEKGFETITKPWDNMKNIDCMIETVIHNNALGVEAGTFDTIHENLWLVGYVSGKSWNSKNFCSDMNDIQVKTAEILRKLTFQYTGYENAGWKSHEI